MSPGRSVTVWIAFIEEGAGTSIVLVAPSSRVDMNLPLEIEKFHEVKVVEARRQYIQKFDHNLNGEFQCHGHQDVPQAHQVLLKAR